MNLNDVMCAVRDSYPGGTIRNYWDFSRRREKSGTGDTLAEFLVLEIKRVWDKTADDRTNLRAAIAAISEAKADVEAVRIRLEQLLGSLPPKGPPKRRVIPFKPKGP